MIQNYFDNVKTFLGSLISNARAREGLGQGHLPFFFSKNHRLAREAGMAGKKEGGLGEGIFARPIVWGGKAFPQFLR